MSEHICKPSCHNPCLLDKHNPYTAPVAPSRSAAPSCQFCNGTGKATDLRRNILIDCPCTDASAAPPSEREAAIGSDLPAFRAELEKQWMSQDVILDFRNWLVVALWNARAAAVPAPGEDDTFIKKVVHFRASCITGSECQDALQELANEAERILRAGATAPPKEGQ